MRSAEEMDQADLELRETILKIWPFTAKDKIRLLVPTVQGEKNPQKYENDFFIALHIKHQTTIILCL